MWKRFSDHTKISLRNKDFVFSVRTWTCENGHSLNRGENAAKHMLHGGLKYY